MRPINATIGTFNGRFSNFLAFSDDMVFFNRGFSKSTGSQIVVIFADFGLL